MARALRDSPEADGTDARARASGRKGQKIAELGASSLSVVEASDGAVNVL